MSPTLSSRRRRLRASGMSVRLSLSITIGVWIFASVVPVGAQGT